MKTRFNPTMSNSNHLENECANYTGLLENSIMNINNQPNNRVKHHRRSSSYRFIAKILILISVLCIILLVLLSVTAFGLFKTYNTLQYLKKEKTKPSKVNLECDTSACYKASSFILSNLNQTINPCEDFYQFTCGNWIDKNENEEKDHFTMAYEKMLQDISDILKMPLVEKEESRLVSNFKLFYQSCINQTDVEFNSDRELVELMTNEVGPWPLVPSLNPTNSDSTNLPAKFLTETRFGIEEHLFKLTYLGTPILFRFESNDFNHTKIIMQIVVPSDFCKIQNFLPHNNQTKKDFFKLMRTLRNYMFESINGGIDFTTAKQQNESIYEVVFEEQIEEMLMLANQIYFVNDSRYNCARRGGSSQKRVNNVFTIEELDQKINNNSMNRKYFDFFKFIEFFNHNANKNILNKKSEVFITSLTLSFLKDLFTGLEISLNFNEAKFKRAFVNLLYFNSIFSLIKPLELFSIPHLHLKLPIRYYHSFFEYSKQINHITPIDNFKSIYRMKREQNCAYTVIEIFSVTDSYEQAELQRLFLNKTFNPNVKTYSNEILSNLKNTTLEILYELDWIDNNIKDKLKDGIEDIEFKIVYSDTLFDNLTNTMNYEYNLSNSYIKNIFTIKKANHDKEFDLLDIQQIKRIRNKKYIFDIFLANLMYLKQYNTLIMPAGILIDPIFNLDNPIYLNYATIGSYLAHEIWHMIDEEILKSEISKIGYEKRLVCLRNNYAKYVHDKYGYEIYGYTSIAEQISDNFGITVALKSYLKLVRKNTNNVNFLKMNQLLPGIVYNQEQLFMIRFAMGFCRKTKLNKEIHEFEQFHAVHEFRALEISLIPEFYDIFKCKIPELDDSSKLKPCKIF